MSRAFVKEDGNDLAPLPDLPVSTHPNHVTPRGLQALRDRLAARQADLAALKSRAERLDRLPEAAAERDIRYLEARLRSAIPVNPADQPTDRVRFGHAVTLRDESGQTRHFQIVGEDEADAARGLIAPQSPLARALLGAEPGDLILWPRPGRGEEMELLDIRHGD